MDIESLKAAIAAPAVRPFVSPIDTNAAKTFYEKLHTQIQDVEKSLQAGESLGLSHLGAGNLCDVESIGFHGRDLIVLSGSDNEGRRCTLLVHLHAVNLKLTVVPGQDPRRKKIGFVGQLGTEPPTAPGTDESA